MTSHDPEEYITVEGWAFDPDSSSSVDLVTLIDKVEVETFSASRYRPDVGATIPGAGDNRGFSQDYVVSPGAHSVCVQADDIGGGTDVVLGCRTVVVASSSPFGYMDEVFVEDGIMTVTGWTIDPNTDAPIEAHLYVDGRGVPDVADFLREDVGAVYPGFGPHHGFEIQIDVAPGEHSVCVFGINVTEFRGQNTLLDCRDVFVPDPSPFGYMDEVFVEDGIMTVTGWTTDPDTVDPIEAHLYVDGRGVADAADYLREDVGAAYPDYGPYHGFAIPVDVEPGKHSVCVFGINISAGRNTLLECRDVVTS